MSQRDSFPGPFAMAIDRDDPRRDRRRSAKSARPALRSAADVALCESVCATVRPWLLAKGYSPGAVAAILEEGREQFRIFRASAGKDPHGFLTRRILRRAEAYRELRGIEGDPAEGTPHLLDVIRTSAALEILGPHARIAIEILYCRGGTFRDVAKALDTNVATARRLVDRALNKLRKWKPPRTWTPPRGTEE
jgi:DNA-directed RNA polymerase specialized sigma24 family protein